MGQHSLLIFSQQESARRSSCSYDTAGIALPYASSSVNMPLLAVNAPAHVTTLWLNAAGLHLIDLINAQNQLLLWSPIAHGLQSMSNNG